MQKIETIIDIEPNAQTPPDPEKAADALADLEFTSGAPEGGTAPSVVEPDAPAKPAKRRTKAELEADNARLAAEVERQKAAMAANAPSLIEGMKVPLALTFEAASGVMVAWRGEHWKIASDKLKLLADAWAPCVAPLLAKHPEAIVWAAALGVTYSVVYPCIQAERTIEQRKKEAAHTGEQTEVMVT